MRCKYHVILAFTTEKSFTRLPFVLFQVIYLHQSTILHIKLLLLIRFQMIASFFLSQTVQRTECQRSTGGWPQVTSVRLVSQCTPNKNMRNSNTLSLFKSSSRLQFCLQLNSCIHWSNDKTCSIASQAKCADRNQKPFALCRCSQLKQKETFHVCCVWIFVTVMATGVHQMVSEVAVERIANRKIK